MKAAVFVVLVACASAYRRYATPIKLPDADKNGDYTYDMLVKKKLTMSYNNDNSARLATPVDYDVNTRLWSRRDPNQLKPCFDNYTMNPNSMPNDESNLEGVLVLDGLHKRVITINDVSPGPLIVVPYNASVYLRVTNMLLMDSLTIHVHGIDKYGMWFMDGVAFVQQCPVHSMNYFEYRFRADNKGTHWYHGHMQTDRGEGLLGGFVVIDPNDRTVPMASGRRVTPTRDYFLLLQDWSTKASEESWLQLEDKTMKWMYGYDVFDKCWEPTRTADGGNVGGAVPLSAIILNEKGWHDHDAVKSRPSDLPLERFLVKSNETLLFRIVNGGTAQELMLYVEDHQMTIVAADGDEVVPMKKIFIRDDFHVDKLIIFPGERYDVLISTLSTPKKQNYFIQVETLQHYFFDWSVIPTTYGFGFLEYEDNGLQEDKTSPNLDHPTCTEQKKCTLLNCPFQVYPNNPRFTCVSYDNLQHPTPETIDKEILKDTPFVTGYEEYFINMHHDSDMDQYRFQFPSGIPYFHGDDMDEIAVNCSSVTCAQHPDEESSNKCRCFYNLQHKLNNIVQVTLYNMGLGGAMGTGYAHPFHVHGVHFHVMKVGWPSYNASGFIDQMNPDLTCAGPNTMCNGATWRNSSWLNGALAGMNTKNPTKRDTITLPVGGYIVIRFRATNPGWWIAHCHLELHLMGGTAYAFKVGDDSQIFMPPKNFPKDCGSFKLAKMPDLVLPTPSGSTGACNILVHICFALIFMRFILTS